MAERPPRPPYASQADLDVLFERMSGMADPKQIDSKWVLDYQLAASQPQAVVSVLKWLRAFDRDGKSLGLWNDMRVEPKRSETLKRLVEESYSAIFELIDVGKASEQDLKGAFISAYESGDTGRHIKCFKTLCGHAGIEVAADAAKRSTGRKSGESGAQSKPKRAPPNSKPPKPPKADVREAKIAPGVGVTLNVEVPADWSEEQVRARLELIRNVMREK